CARRLHQGKFRWADTTRGDRLGLDQEQLNALVQGLPWLRLGSANIIRRL
ncbi:MAG: IS66 family insertion sequence element accessory protein TnpB, partial [Oceanospirillaceae bacterium]|nr:IS66 family insertion sequence element accessory protein TnpB [Oceanospirillaceae bacterium]